MKNFLAVKASAGSGKTFALTVRYISLLLKGATPTSILALTFTNKAANEMSERVFNTLKTLGENKIYLEQISKVSALSEDEILKRKNSLLQSFLNSELSIYTIDKFVNKILREFSGYIGIGDDFSIKSDDEESLSYKFLKSLDLSTFDKLIEFAYYESKKFGSIFELFQSLLEKNEEFEVLNIESNIVALQKDVILQKALKLKEFILNCDVASNSSKKAVDFENFEELLDKGKTWLTKDTAADFRDFKKCANSYFEELFQDLKIDIASYFRLRSTFSLATLKELFLKYRDFKERHNIKINSFSFSDISNAVYKLLSEKIDKEFLYFRLDSKYNHILIDEFQDTSLLQFKILKPLIEETLSGDDGKFKSFFYVGDTKQSIYRFRGGMKELFDYVINSYPQIEKDELNVNYRSKDEVVEFINRTFKPLVNYGYFNQESQEAGGYVEVFEDDKLSSDETFENLGLKIEKLLEEGIDYNNIAILTYTNDDVLEIDSYLSSNFPKMKIATEMSSKLINQENVKACINAIKYLYFNKKIYLENLNALIGNPPNTKLEFSFDFRKSSVRELILNVANYFNIVDENVIKLVKESTQFFDVVDFIYEIDKLEAVIDSKEQKGLQILTIFKSKGLEFDTVFLIDRIKNKNADRSSLLFDYDGITLNNLFYKVSKLDSFDKNYENALKKEKKLQLDDDINILYVAMTRAKNNLIILKKSEKSVFDIVNLKPSTFGKLVLETISQNYIKVVEEIEYKPLDLGRQESKSSSKNDDLDFDLKARYFGIATHFCLEMLNEFTLKSLENSISLTFSRFHSYLDEEDFSDIKNRIKMLIENFEFQSYIKDSQTLKEQAIIYNDEVKVLDLLVQKDENYYIFDYKTTSNLKDEHMKQVNLYKKALKDILNTQNVYSFLVLMKSDEVLIKEVK